MTASTDPSTTTSTAALVAAAKQQLENLDAAATAREIADGALVVDLREDSERASTGSIPGAVHVPRGLLEFWADPALPSYRPVLDPGRRTVLYCAVGGRSALAGSTLRDLGYADVAHLEGGIEAWIAEGRPVEQTD